MNKNARLKYDFTNIEIIITDSKDLLNFAYKNKLSRKAKIFSTSPSINFDETLNVIKLEKYYSLSKNIKLKESIKKLFYKISFFLGKHKNTKILNGIAMREICLLIPFYERCLLLNSLNLKKKILVLEHQNYRTPYEELFSNLEGIEFLILNNTDTEIKNFTLEKYKSKFLQKENLILTILNYFKSIKQQWLISKWMWFFYPFLKFMWKMINFLRLNKGFLIINDSSLIRETSCWLSMAGYSFTHERFLIEDIYRKSQNSKNDEVLQEKLKKIFQDHFKSFFSDTLNKAISKISSYKISIHYNSMKEVIPKFDEFIEKKNIKAVMSVIFKNVAQFAFYESLKKKKIKLILFQHGVAREISKFCDYLTPFLEGSNSDFFITFNKKSKDLYSNSKLNTALNFDVGVSKDYFIKSKLEYNNFPPILYNFTGIYMNQKIISRGLLDSEIAIFEISILNRVLKKLPHKVLFKTYPNTWDYPDENPILKEANKIENLKVYNKNIDSRFIMHKSRIIVTSRLTSTLSWSIMSGKPVIFLNIDETVFSRSDVMKYIKDSIIVFDKNEKNFYSHARSFLSKPIDEIKYLYEKKKIAREKFIKNFITSQKNQVGKKISKIIKDA